LYRQGKATLWVKWHTISKIVTLYSIEAHCISVQDLTIN
jgi:hypothetical protein